MNEYPQCIQRIIPLNKQTSVNNELNFSLHKKQCKEKDLTENQSD
jgi:hypothetical protein